MKKFSFSRAASLWSVGLVVMGLMSLGAAAQTLTEKVADEGELTIGIYNSWPAGFVENGEVQGYGVDILKEILKPLGVEKIDFKVMEFGALIPSLLAKRIDVIAGGLYITPERCKQVAYSNPVGGPQGNAILVKTGNPLNIHSYQDMADNAKVRVGNLRGAASLEYMALAGVPEERIQLFPDHQTGLAALLADRVDMLINSTGPVIGSLRDPNVDGLERATPFKEVVNGKEVIHYTAFAFRPEDAEFRNLVNEKLSDIKDIVYKNFIEYGYSEREATTTDVTAESLCGSDYM